MSIRSCRVLIPSLIAVGLATANPAPAEAQRRAVVVHRPVARPVVVLHAYTFPRFGRYGYWRPYGSWGPYAPYGYGYGFRDDTATLRLQVSPREAEVFVDGYSAGAVDDFDGVFQRLRLRPGGHEIVVYLDGYRTLRRNLYLNPGSNQTIRHVMEPLRAGEPMAPRPEPGEPTGPDVDTATPRPPYDPRPMPEPPAGRTEPRGRFGTLSVRVQPSDAEIVIDGERWSGTAEAGVAVSIELPAGRHQVEVRKEGFTTYREDVLIRPNATLRLNLSLLPGA